MPLQEKKPGNLMLVGGRLCLDFVNTVSCRLPDLSRDYLNSYADLIEWSRHAGLLTAKEVKRLNELAALHPTEALAVFKKSLDLRELLYRIFFAITRQQTPLLADRIAFNAEIKTALNKLSVTTTKAGFTWRWDPIPGVLDGMLWPIIKCAADLLTSGDLHKMKQCAGEPNCGWLFIDTSKNQSRRWCRMDLCGSRDKSHNYYRKKRAISKSK